MLAIRQADGWLVEKRPPAGIWGGLWSLPQTEPSDGQPEPVAALAERLAQRHGLVLSAPALAVQAPAFVHAFTHFRLRIETWCCAVSGANGAAAPGAIWLSDDEIAGAALPRPVKRLLLALGGARATTGR
jgi:A/G-specific adenine glycosylase